MQRFAISTCTDISKNESYALLIFGKHRGLLVIRKDLLSLSILSVTMDYFTRLVSIDSLWIFQQKKPRVYSQLYRNVRIEFIAVKIDSKKKINVV